MVKVSDLSGAALDYYVALAEGVQADELEICLIPMPENRHLAPGGLMCTRNYFDSVNYSTDWAEGGPLVDKYKLDLDSGTAGCYLAGPSAINRGYWSGLGDTPLQAICRAVVRAAFGDEVEEVLP